MAAGVLRGARRRSACLRAAPWRGAASNCIIEGKEFVAVGAGDRPRALPLVADERGFAPKREQTPSRSDPAPERRRRERSRSRPAHRSLPSLGDAVRAAANGSRPDRPRHRVAPCPCSASPGRSASSARSPTATRSASTPTTPPPGRASPDPTRCAPTRAAARSCASTASTRSRRTTRPAAAGRCTSPSTSPTRRATSSLRWLGFRGIERTGETVTAATPEELPGYLLTRGADVYGRCVALIGRGDAPGGQRRRRRWSGSPTCARRPTTG